MWNGFSWLRTETSRILSVKAIMKSRVSERREISWLSELPSLLKKFSAPCSHLHNINYSRHCHLLSVTELCYNQMCTYCIVLKGMTRHLRKLPTLVSDIWKHGSLLGSRTIQLFTSMIYYYEFRERWGEKEGEKIISRIQYWNWHWLYETLTAWM